MSDAVVSVKKLTKEFRKRRKKAGVGGAISSLVRPKYESVKAVNGISFSVTEGEFVGFLGPNGAGKTTTLKILAGILRRSAGEASVLGHDPFRREPSLLSQIALVMGNKQQLWWDLPAWDSFVLLRELYGVPQTKFKSMLDELLPMLNLEDKLQTQVRKMSLGERMKCELVAALLHQPRVVFLDEPTIGLDIVSQVQIRKFLKRQQERTGCTILLTSHYMKDVSELCERIILINGGHLLFDGPLGSLRQGKADEKRATLKFLSAVDDADIARYGTVRERSERRAVVSMPRSEVATRTAAMLEALPIEDMSLEEPPIEDLIADAFSAPVSRETSE